MRSSTWLLAFALCFPCPPCIAQSEPWAPELAGMRRDDVVNAVVADPGALVVAVAAATRAHAPDLDVRALLASSREGRDFAKALDELGVALDDPATWSRAGVAAHRPMRMALGHPATGWLKLPRTGTGSVAVDDEERARAAFAKLAPEAAARVHGNDLWLMHGAADEVPAVELLRRRLAGEEDAGTPLGDDSAFALLRARAGAFAAGLHANHAVIWPQASVRAWLAALTADGVTLVVAPRENAQWMANTGTGGDCRDLLARFQQPAFAASGSFADPIAVWRGLHADGAFDDDTIARVDRVLALVGEDAPDRLRHASLAILVWPRALTLAGARHAFAIHVHGAARVVANLRERAAELALPLEAEGAFLRGKGDGWPVILGAIGDFVVFGDAVHEIQRAAVAERALWQPLVGGRELFAAELDPVQLARAVDRPRGEAALDALAAAGRFVMTFDAEPAGLVVELELEGAPRGEFVARVALIAALLLGGS